MLYPVELQSLLFPKRERKCRGNYGANKGNDIHHSLRGVRALFLTSSMVLLRGFLVLSIGLLAGALAIPYSAFSQGGLTPTQWREAIADQSLSVDIRDQFLDSLYFHYKRGRDNESYLDWVDTLEATSKAPLPVAITWNITKKSAACLIRQRRLNDALDLLNAQIDAWKEDRTVELADLLAYRAEQEWKAQNAAGGFQQDQFSSILGRVLSDHNQAMEIAVERGDRLIQDRIHSKLATVYGDLQDWETALFHYQEIILNSENRFQQAQARVNWAAIDLLDTRSVDPSTLTYLEEARNTYRDLFNENRNDRYQRYIGTTTYNIAKYHFDTGDLDRAQEEFFYALNQLQLATNWQVKSYQALGEIELVRNNPIAAEAHFSTALTLQTENGVPPEESFDQVVLELRIQLGNAFIEDGEHSRGLALCDSVSGRIDLAPVNTISGQVRAMLHAQCWDCMGDASRLMGRGMLAADAYQRRDAYHEEELELQRVEESEAMVGQRALQDVVNNRIRKRNEETIALQKQVQYYLYVGVAVLIAFALFITYRYRFTRRQSQLISTQRQQLADRQRELIRANADLEIALNHKAVFLSNMSHEIRTPLNAIVGMSNLATKEDMTEGARKYLRNIVTASSNLIDIVNDILDFSKLEAGKLEIASEPFSVQDALEVAENVMRIPAEQKDLTFSVESDASLPSHLMGDASRLNQVLINLIGNAIKFTLDGGVTLNASLGDLPSLPTWCPSPQEEHDRWFVVRVQDTGIGIPADKQEKIFESFNQGDQLKTRKFGGTGLGLSISKQIVELQGGVIWVESEEGVGSTFCFALPAEVAEVEVEEAAAEEANEDIGPLRVLIAEDNPFNIIVTEDTLNAEFDDITIGKAENGQIAFDMVRDGEWDLVLMDIHMPEMSGLEATAAIRKLPNEKSTTLIVAMTASVLREETDNYMRHGMDGFVPKPFKAEQLRGEIVRLQKARLRGVDPNLPQLPPLRILIAEDNPFNVIVAEDTLKTEMDNVTIGKAENGRFAFEAVRDGEWDIVLMDIAMPEMTGIEATLAIRKLEDPVKASTTIIAMTASALKEDTDHYVKKGMDGYVPKPFKVEQLIREIQRAHFSKEK